MQINYKYIYNISTRIYILLFFTKLQNNKY